MINIRFMFYVLHVAVLPGVAAMAEGPDRDYWDFCRNNKDLVVALGDGRVVEESAVQAQAKLGAMGVDLYNFLLWEITNADRVASLFPYPPYYQPGLHTIPTLLYRSGDPRVLPHAKAYMREQFEAYRKTGMSPNHKAVKCLLWLGREDPESIQMIRQCVTTPQHGLSLANTALRDGLSPDARMPDQIMADIINAVSGAKPGDPDLPGLLGDTVKELFRHPPVREEDLVQMMGVCLDKIPTCANRESVRYLIDDAIKSALSDYPADRKLPVAVLDRLVALARSADFVKWEDVSIGHQKALQERRVRDREKRTGNVPGIPGPGKSQVIKDAGNNDARSSGASNVTEEEDTADSRSTTHGVWRIVVGGVVVIVCIVVALCVLRQRSRWRT